MQNRAVRAQDAVEKVQKWLHALPRRRSGKIGGVQDSVQVNFQVDNFWTVRTALERPARQPTGAPPCPLGGEFDRRRHKPTWARIRGAESA